ncbi:MAG TPA: hypothetical protein ENI92_02440, partial [Bacteroidetes bacterium]|nr:hypothetical protein [Bacteroidota bacterium]
AKPPQSAATVVEGREVYVPLAGLIDIEAEKARVTREIDKLEGLLAGVEKKLANDRFTANAPEEVVDREREKLAGYRARLAKLKAHAKGLA